VPAITPTDQGLVRGELDPSMRFNLADGYSMTLSGSVFFGQAVLGGSAALNLKAVVVETKATLVGLGT
jgi:hypothetical protein